MRCIAITCFSLFAAAGCAFDESEGLPGDGEIAMADGLVQEEELDEETAELESHTSPSDIATAVGEAELTDATIENAGPGVAPNEANLDGEGRGEEASLGPDAVRIYVGEGACHTHEYLSQLAFQRCYQLGWNSAGAFNYTQACRGWWGAGAQRLWVTCFNN
jgi:hypothetical protein